MVFSWGFVFVLCASKIGKTLRSIRSVKDGEERHKWMKRRSRETNVGTVFIGINFRSFGILVLCRLVVGIATSYFDSSWWIL